MIGKLLILLAVLVGSTLVGIFVLPAFGINLSLHSVTQAFQPVQQTIMGLPFIGTLLGLGGTAVSSIVALVLRRGRDQATTTANQLASELSSATTQNVEMQDKLQAFTEFQKTYGDNAMDSIAAMGARLKETELALQTKTAELTAWAEKEHTWMQQRSRLEDERRYLNAKVKELEYELGVKDGTIKPPVP